MTKLGDSYQFSRFYEDINSIVVPEPETGWSQALVLVLLLGGVRTRCRSARKG
jgi:hypothetical protein